MHSCIYLHIKMSFKFISLSLNKLSSIFFSKMSISGDYAAFKMYSLVLC